MRLKALGCALLAVGFAAPAYASMCRIDSGATCPSAMPVGGYCECNVHGQNVGGTIVSGGYSRGTANPFQPGAPLASPGHNTAD
jgi:hypothetical protein